MHEHSRMWKGRIPRNSVCPSCLGYGDHINYRLRHYPSCDGDCSELCPVQEEFLVGCEMCNCTGIPPIPWSELNK